jgi:hypothetical protein
MGRVLKKTHGPKDQRNSARLAYGNRQSHNTISGLPEQGFAMDIRHQMTPFGSVWQGIYKNMEEFIAAPRIEVLRKVYARARAMSGGVIGDFSGIAGYYVSGPGSLFQTRSWRRLTPETFSRAGINDVSPSYLIHLAASPRTQIREQGGEAMAAEFSPNFSRNETDAKIQILAHESFEGVESANIFKSELNKLDRGDFSGKVRGLEASFGGHVSPAVIVDEAMFGAKMGRRFYEQTKNLRMKELSLIEKSIADLDLTSFSREEEESIVTGARQFREYAKRTRKIYQQFEKKHLKKFQQQWRDGRDEVGFILEKHNIAKEATSPILESDLQQAEKRGETFLAEIHAREVSIASRLASGGREAQNTIKAFPEDGLNAIDRHARTPFGSAIDFRKARELGKKVLGDINSLRIKSVVDSADMSGKVLDSVYFNMHRGTIGSIGEEKFALTKVLGAGKQGRAMMARRGTGEKAVFKSVKDIEAGKFGINPQLAGREVLMSSPLAHPIHGVVEKILEETKRASSPAEYLFAREIKMQNLSYAANPEVTPKIFAAGKRSVLMEYAGKDLSKETDATIREQGRVFFKKHLQKNWGEDEALFLDPHFGNLAYRRVNNEIKFKVLDYGSSMLRSEMKGYDPIAAVKYLDELPIFTSAEEKAARELATGEVSAPAFSMDELDSFFVAPPPVINKADMAVATRRTQEALFNAAHHGGHGHLKQK